MNIRYPIYEGVYRILTVVIRIFAPCPFRKRKYAIMPPKNVYICVSII